MTGIITELRRWAGELNNNKAGHPTWREDAKLLNQAAKEIEELRAEIARLKERVREVTPNKR
jgi:hypothetical protein